MIPTKPFGRTGHDSTRVIFGAAAFSGASQEVADRTMEQVLAWGIDHIDPSIATGSFSPPRPASARPVPPMTRSSARWSGCGPTGSI